MDAEHYFCLHHLKSTSVKEKKMKNKRKVILSLILAIAIVLGGLPVSAFAASDTFIEVTKDNAPVRTKAYESGDVIERLEEGTILQADACWNLKGHRWYRVELSDGRSGYIYSKNVQKHEHNFNEYNTQIGTFLVCEQCGRIEEKHITDVKKGSAVKAFAINAVMHMFYDSSPSGVLNVVTGGMTASGAKVYTYSSAYALPLTLAVADGPAPIGDIIGAAIVVAGGAAALHDAASFIELNEVVDLDTFAASITAGEFLDRLKNRERECDATTFRRVVRESGGLRYADDICMDWTEAYICVVLGIDVYTPFSEIADQFSALFTFVRMERDKDPTHYWHYHAYDNQGIKIRAHIFFGANDYGAMPHY